MEGASPITRRRLRRNLEGTRAFQMLLQYYVALDRFRDSLGEEPPTPRPWWFWTEELHRAIFEHASLTRPESLRVACRRALAGEAKALRARRVPREETT